MPKLVVIGSGVFGAWTALLARRLGYPTTLFDSRGPANDLSSSGGESRIIRLAYGADELYTRFAARSLDLWRAFFDAENRGECFQKTGALWIATAGEPMLDRVKSIFDKLGIGHEYMQGEQLRQRYPQFAFPPNAGAIFEPESGALLAARSVQAVFAAGEREGVTYRRDCVLPPSGSGSRLASIDTASGARVDADIFVFAAGAWLPRVFPDVLGDRIFPTRQELFFFAAPVGNSRFQASAMPVWIDQTARKIAYGFPDLEGAGVKVAFHELGPRFDPETGNREVSAEQVREAAAYLGQRCPAMRGARLLSTRVCPYENTSSGDFLIDRHPQWTNVWFLGGGSGHGFKHGPAVAEYVLKAMDGTVEEEPRFLLHTKQRVLNREVV